MPTTANDQPKQTALPVKDDDLMNCYSTITACALLSLDAICCIPCCMGCGGCCGKYEPCVTSAVPGFETEPGQERFGVVCLVQCMAAMMLPFTFCGCCWACCGTCTPCAVGVINLVKSNNDPVTATKPPKKQTFEREP